MDYVLTKEKVRKMCDFWYENKGPTFEDKYIKNENSSYEYIVIGNKYTKVENRTRTVIDANNDICIAKDTACAGGKAIRRFVFMYKSNEIFFYKHYWKINIAFIIMCKFKCENIIDTTNESINFLEKKIKLSKKDDDDFIVKINDEVSFHVKKKTACEISDHLRKMSEIISSEKEN